ncbi:hypothetical protein SCA6_004895 [Theobroma cacao]
MKFDVRYFFLSTTPKEGSSKSQVLVAKSKSTFASYHGWQIGYPDNFFKFTKTPFIDRSSCPLVSGHQYGETGTAVKPATVTQWWSM